MPFVDPMLASPMKDGFDLQPKTWVAEEKFDGHRMLVSVAENGGNLFGDPSVTAWSRNGIPRILPVHLRMSLEKLPSGIYDGELIMPGKQSTGVTVVEDQNKLKLIVFDAIDLLGRDVKKETYTTRRMLLETIFKSDKVRGLDGLALAQSQGVDSIEDVLALRDTVWARGGEGLILKRTASHYAIGKRTKDWIKVKQLKSEVMTLVGYRQGELGPHSRLVFRDSDGNIVPVKWKDYAMLEDLKINHQIYVDEGKKASIEYQHRADDGGYRHPRFDHWLEQEVPTMGGRA